MVNEDDEFERIEMENKYKLDSTKAAVVADDYYWIPIDASTPTNVKILLLGRSGVATLIPAKAIWCAVIPPEDCPKPKGK